jgi:MFS family permease
VTTAIKAATPGGAVVGQLGLRWFADMIGRRKIYGVELAIIILATLARSLSAPGSYWPSPCVFSTVLTRWKHFCRGSVWVLSSVFSLARLKSNCAAATATVAHPGDSN